MPKHRRPGRRVDVTHRRAELRAALKKVAARRGPQVSLNRFCRESGFPATQVYRYFRSWPELRRQAGLPAQIDRSQSSCRYKRERLIAALQQLAGDVGPQVTLMEFYHHTGISPPPIYRLFGNWLDFKVAAGLPGERKPALPGEYTRETLQDKLREAMTYLGSGITLMQFCEVVGISRTTVQRLGGWGELRLSVGLSRHGRRLQRPSVESMIHTLRGYQQSTPGSRVWGADACGVPPDLAGHWSPPGN